MTAERRIRAIALLNRIEKNPEIAQELGINVRVNFEKASASRKRGERERKVNHEETREN